MAARPGPLRIARRRFPPDPIPAPVPRAHLPAADEEPFFRDDARRWAEALRRAGGDVRMAERRGGHDGPFSRAELPQMIRWMVGDG